MKKYLIYIALILGVLATFFFMERKIERLTSERDRYKGNTQILLSDVERFRVQDSLSGARVQSLELTIREFERFRADDAQLIKQLQARNRDLSQVNETQSQTIINLMATPKDTIVVVRDSIWAPATSVHCGDAWYDFNGLLVENQFSGTLVNRDSLVLAETVKFERFLGFLWKTRRVKDREMNVVSRNPHTQIMNVEHIVIEKK